MVANVSLSQSGGADMSGSIISPATGTELWRLSATELVRSRGMGYVTAAVEAIAHDAPPLTKAIAFIVRNVPGAKLAARGLDFFVGDPLHHYMETGVLHGIKARAEGEYACPP
jgi:hypothetical protein